LNAELSEERRLLDTLRQELRQHPEQLARLSTQLADAQADAATARGQRDALQDRVRDLERQLQLLSLRRPEERGAAATRADLDALTSQLRGEIRDLARGLKDVQSPLPRILAMTREVREATTSIQASQGHTIEALQRLEQASNSLSDTADYLVALAEEDLDEAFDDEDVLDQDEDEGEEFGGADDADEVEDPADDDDDTESGGNANDGTPRAASDAPNIDAEDWQSEFERIEAAWMAGRRVGDPHEAINFLHLLGDLNFDDRAPSEVMASFDRFRARAGGDRFSYCPLHSAVHLVHMKKPSLDNGLVLVRYRELARLAPCKSIEDCPGVGASVSEILGRS
jgi:chromosome segregation ATPase